MNHEDTEHLEHPFMDFAISETMRLIGDNAWDKFLDTVSKLTGIENLDGCSIKGDIDYTGYSLDELNVWFRADMSAAEAAYRIKDRRAKITEFSMSPEEALEVFDACAHDFVYTGSAYGGDDESFHGEGRCYCSKCGTDGDA